MKDTNFQQLILRIKHADHEAFRTLFDLFQQSIFQFLLYKTKDPAVAEDLLQEVFVNIWRSRDKLDEHRSIKNYLYTTADNLALNSIRHNKVVTRYQQENEPRIFTNTENPQYLMEEAEWNMLLAKAIESLPESTREIFLMSRIEDLTYDEIGERLSLSKKSVEGHIVKALRILREKIPFKL
jgi:RNA polymerase sigma-70 factor (family 1)